MDGARLWPGGLELKMGWEGAMTATAPADGHMAEDVPLAGHLRFDNPYVAAGGVGFPLRGNVTSDVRGSSCPIKWLLVVSVCSQIMTIPGE